MSMSRAIFSIVFSVLSIAFLAAGLMLGPDHPAADILADLGTELFGILVTIALVDWVLERRRRQDRGRELAWGVLHDIERAVWIWQGGPRHLGTDELLGIVGGIGSKDEMEPSTHTLFLGIGLGSRSLIQTEPSALRSLPGLLEASQDLTSLATGNEHPPSTLIPLTIEVLSASITSLARVLGLPTQRIPPNLIWNRDPSPEGQEARHQQLWPNSAGVTRGWRENSRTPSTRPGGRRSFKGRDTYPER